MKGVAASTVHALVERQAALRPHAVYARSTESERQVTYGELALGCRRVAAALRAHGCLLYTSDAADE